MRMCLPSKEPKQCGKFHLSSKPFEILSHSFWQFGAFKNWSFKVWNIVSDISAKILFIVAFPVRQPKLISSCCVSPVAKYLNVTTSLCSADIDFLNWVVCLEINGTTSDNKCSNLLGDQRRHLKKMK